MSSAESEGYYSHPRNELHALVPDGVRRVIDVGCGAGGLGLALKRARPALEVRGIELVAEQAARAKLVLDDAVSQSAELPPPAHWPRPDCLIFADVLEHLVDPWATLRSWRGWVDPGTWVVISLPNVVHFSILAGLLAGQWEYEQEGLLDRTHLRFFARKSMRALLTDAGLELHSVTRAIRTPRFIQAVSVLQGTVRFLRDRERRGARLGPLRTGVLDLTTFQFLVCARTLP